MAEIILFWGQPRRRKFETCRKMLTATSVLLALLLALAVAAPVLHAPDWDHINGRDKVHDPTGAWLIRSSLLTGPAGELGAFRLVVFHKGGTLTARHPGWNRF